MVRGDFAQFSAAILPWILLPSLVVIVASKYCHCAKSNLGRKNKSESNKVFCMVVLWFCEVLRSKANHEAVMQQKKAYAPSKKHTLLKKSEVDSGFEPL